MFTIKRLMWAVCATMSFAGSLAYAQAPIHRWSFDEGSGNTAVDTGAGPQVNGTLGPGAIRIPGTVGSGAVRFNAFDLNGYVQMPGSVGALGTGDFTISFWVQKTPSRRFGELLGNRGAQSSAGNFVDFRASDVGASLEISETEGMRGYIGIVANFHVADGAWHKITGVRSGPNAWLYVDGVLAAAGSSGDGVTANLVERYPFTVGANDVERQFPELNCGCGFDDVLVYDRALDAFEIAFTAHKFALLTAAVDAMDIEHGVANALGAKIEAAQAYYAAGDNLDAIAVLGAFMNQLAAQSGKKLTAEQAEQLGGMAQILVDELAS